MDLATEHPERAHAQLTKITGVTLSHQQHELLRGYVCRTMVLEGTELSGFTLDSVELLDQLGVLQYVRFSDRDLDAWGDMTCAHTAILDLILEQGLPQITRLMIDELDTAIAEESFWTKTLDDMLIPQRTLLIDMTDYGYGASVQAAGFFETNNTTVTSPDSNTRAYTNLRLEIEATQRQPERGTNNIVRCWYDDGWGDHDLYNVTISLGQAMKFERVFAGE